MWGLLLVWGFVCRKVLFGSIMEVIIVICEGFVGVDDDGVCVGS